jgi:ribosomal protein L22
MAHRRTAAPGHRERRPVRAARGDRQTGHPGPARLRFGPGRTCEAIARLLDRAIVRAESAGLDPQLLVVADGSAEAGEDIVRVRRKVHGVADWIHSPTCRVRIVLHTAGLRTPGQAAGTPGPSPADPVAADPVAPVPPAEPSAEAAVRDALAEVIDPDSA